MTYTMLGFCRRTGEIGIASATFSVAVGARLGQRVAAGGREWMIASQAVARPGLGFEAGDLLGRGVVLDDLGGELAAADPGLSWRQIAVLERDGPSLVLTGADASRWCGHAALADGVAVGNALAGAAVVDAMAEGFAARAEDSLAERLVYALERGRSAGGQADRTGTPMPELSAFVRVFSSDADPFVYGTGGRSAVFDLRVDLDPHPIGVLRRLLDACRPLRPAYELRARDPAAFQRRTTSFERDLAAEIGAKPGSDVTNKRAGSD